MIKALQMKGFFKFKVLIKNKNYFYNEVGLRRLLF